MLRFDRKQQNPVKQLSFNKKINSKNRNRKGKKKRPPGRTDCTWSEGHIELPEGWRGLWSGHLQASQGTGPLGSHYLGLEGSRRPPMELLNQNMHCPCIRKIRSNASMYGGHVINQK